MLSKNIAVLLSAYNGEKYIEEQIRSVLNQTIIKSVTIIVRNDGSCDKTEDILEKLQKENKNIEIIKGENKGLVASFFELLKYAYNQGFDFFSFCDQDDYWLPDKLSAAIRALEGYDEPCMYSCCSELVDSNLLHTGNITQRKIREITFFNSAIQNFCPGHNQVLNRAMAGLIVKYTISTSLIYSQDMWISTVASLTGKIIYDNTPYTLYRQHENNQLSFGKNKIEWAKDHLNRLKKGEGRKIAIQLKYCVNCYSDYLSEYQKEEIHYFFGAQKSVFKRISYALHSKLYRQKKIETLIFKLLYVFGGYNN